MNRVPWCCGLSLERGVRILAWTDILVEILAMAANIESLVTNVGRLRSAETRDKRYASFHDTYSNTTGTELTESQAIIVITLVTIAIAIHLIELFIVNMLMSGATERNAQKCSRWNVITSVLTVIDALLFFGHLAIEFDVWLVAFMVLNVVYKSYSVATVDAFRREVEEYGNVNTASDGPIRNDFT